jgi:hypothetical protein
MDRPSICSGSWLRTAGPARLASQRKARQFLSPPQATSAGSFAKLPWVSFGFSARAPWGQDGRESVKPFDLGARLALAGPKRGERAEEARNRLVFHKPSPVAYDTPGCGAWVFTSGREGEVACSRRFRGTPNQLRFGTMDSNQRTGWAPSPASRGAFALKQFPSLSVRALFHSGASGPDAPVLFDLYVPFQRFGAGSPFTENYPMGPKKTCQCMSGIMEPGLRNNHT